MAYVTRTFDSATELTDYLNDIVLGKSLRADLKVHGLDAKTFIVHDGTADRTCTFVDASGEGLLPKEIMAQIQLAHASLALVTLRSYAHNAPPTVQIAVVTATHAVQKEGTANTILGFGTAADVTVGANAVASSDVLAVFNNENNRVGVIHE